MTYIKVNGVVIGFIMSDNPKQEQIDALVAEHATAVKAGEREAPVAPVDRDVTAAYNAEIAK